MCVYLAIVQALLCKDHGRGLIELHADNITTRKPTLLFNQPPVYVFKHLNHQMYDIALLQKILSDRFLNGWSMHVGVLV